MHVEDFGPAPLDEASVYPGRWPSTDLLMAGSCLWSVQTASERRLEQWKVRVDGCQHSEAHGLRGPSVPLSYALLRLNVTPMAHRRPFLAVGSNANPTQLHKKLTDRGVRAVVPLTVADTSGLRVGFSAHTFGGGYVPTTAVVGHGGQRRLLICWLDEGQARALDQSEGNYQPTRIGSKDGCSFTLTSGESLESVIAYVTKRGVQADDNGHMIELSDDPGQWTGQQAALWERAPRIFPTNTVVGQPGSECEPYGKQGGIDGDGLLVLPTTGSVKRGGDAVVQLNSRDFDALGEPNYAAVQGISPVGLTPIRLVAKALRASAEDVAPGQVRADQVVRNALGIELRERVTLTPVAGPRVDLGAAIAPDPTYAICRVQAAPLVAMERGIVVLEEMAMRVIGVETGDQVVLEGVPTQPGAAIPTVRARAIAATDEVMESREQLVGGGIQSRYPSGLDALGVWPDLPWAFLDHSIRERLNLAGSRVAAVRVRASRRDLLLKEARELGLLLALAAIGLLTLVDNPAGRAAAVAGVVLLGLIIVTVRLRHRVAKGG